MLATSEVLPLPPFKTGADIVRSQAHLLRPHEEITVSAWAQRNRGYDPDTLPWQSEVMDALGDPMIEEVGLLGPAQAGKSDIGLGWTGWIIDTNPSDMLICQPSQDLASTFVTTRLDPMIETTAAVNSKLQPVQNANNIKLKQFRGMYLATVWPVPAQFAQRPIRYGWLDDYDQMDENIGESGGEGGQGSALALLEGRLTSYEGRSTKFVSSSPADDNGGKTEAFVAGGTDERINPCCPQCGERWELDIMRDLRFDQSGTIDQAEASAYVVCQASGCILGQDQRRALIASLKILPNRGFVASNPDATRRRRTFRIDGLMGLTSWGKLARLWREAQIAWQSRQDETALRTFVNTKAGKNYRPVTSGEKPLERTDLAYLRDDHWRSGTVPAGPVVITLAVDCQHDRFEVIAKGWAAGHESWTIDRWSIEVLDDRLTSLQPFRKSEHWRVLLPLFDRTFTVQGGGLTPPPLCIAIDTGGGGDRNEATATDNARKFWHMARAAGIHSSRIMLVKGASKREGELVKMAAPADRTIKGRPVKSAPQLWLVNVHRAKNVIDTRLRRREPGPGRMHFPADFADEYFDELTAEELIKGRWQRRRPRNETLDLEIYAWAALVKPPFARSRDHMDWVPPSFRLAQPSATTPQALPAVDMASSDAVSETKKEAPSPADQSGSATRRAGHDDWLGPVGGNWFV